MLNLVLGTFEVCLTPWLVLLALRARFRRKPIDVGLGPEPLINNVYHKKALERYGYRAETFVNYVSHITDQFDVRGDQLIPLRSTRLRKPLKYVASLWLFARALTRYRCLYIYFDGGTLGLTTALLWRIEPLLYKLAGVQVVVMPYGSDVQEMSRSPNLLFKHVYSMDYPQLRLRRRTTAAKIDLWTRRADHVIGGCEWVDYMYYWDTLMLAHFSIDVEMWRPAADRPAPSPEEPFRVLHAPNHRAIKGTSHFHQAVADLRAEGWNIELVILEKVSNDAVRQVMAEVDVVADQLIIGWYAMFALEAMAMEKPVLCYLRPDLEHLYTAAGLIAPGEIPIVNCSVGTVKDTLRELIIRRDTLPALGARSRRFVLAHHSIDAVGGVFDKINREIGVRPRAGRRTDGRGAPRFDEGAV